MTPALHHRSSRPSRLPSTAIGCNRLQSFSLPPPSQTLKRTSRTLSLASASFALFLALAALPASAIPPSTFVLTASDDWTSIDIPFPVDTANAPLHGVAWFKRDFEFDRTPNPAFNVVAVDLGTIDAHVEIFVNGESVSVLDADSTVVSPTISAKCLSKGSNTLAVRLDLNDQRGFLSRVPENFAIHFASVVFVNGFQEHSSYLEDQHNIPLAGQWQYKFVPTPPEDSE